MRKFLLTAALAASACFAQAIAFVGLIDGISAPNSVSVFSGDMVTMSTNVTNGADMVTVRILNSDGQTVYSYDLSPNASGGISFSWFPLFDGTFRVEATSWLNGILLGSESVAIVSSVRPDAAGFVTGGGWFQENSGRSTFGFVAQVMRNGSIRGNLEFQDHLGRNNWKSQSLDWVYVASPTTAYFSGLATRSGGPVYRFFVEVKDFGEPGRADSLELWVYDPITGTLEFSYSGLLNGGNIQVHVR